MTSIDPAAQEVELVGRLERAIQRAAALVKRLQIDGSAAERESIRAADAEVRTLTGQLEALRRSRAG